MLLETVSKAIRHNVRALMDDMAKQKRINLQAVRARMVAAGIGDGTIGRARDGYAGLTIKSLVRIAEFFRVPPSALLQLPESSEATGLASSVNRTLLVDAIRMVQQQLKGARIPASNFSKAVEITYRNLEEGIGMEHAQRIVVDILSAMGTADEQST